MELTSISIRKAENGCIISCSLEGYNDEGEKNYENKEYTASHDLMQRVYDEVSGEVGKKKKATDGVGFMGEKTIGYSH